MVTSPCIEKMKIKYMAICNLEDFQLQKLPYGYAVEINVKACSWKDDTLPFRKNNVHSWTKGSRLPM